MRFHKWAQKELSSIKILKICKIAIASNFEIDPPAECFKECSIFICTFLFFLYPPNGEHTRRLFIRSPFTFNLFPPFSSTSASRSSNTFSWTFSLSLIFLFYFQAFSPTIQLIIREFLNDFLFIFPIRSENLFLISLNETFLSWSFHPPADRGVLAFSLKTSQTFPGLWKSIKYEHKGEEYILLQNNLLKSQLIFNRPMMLDHIPSLI